MSMPISEAVSKGVLDYLTAHQEAMVAILKDLVLAESPSDVPASQQRVLTLLTTFLTRLAFQVEIFPGLQTGGYLVARPLTGSQEGGTQLLVGHCDTVWAQGTLATMPVEIHDGMLRGPGVFDMKSGLIQILYALQAIQDLGLNPGLDPVVFINTDEEIGSSESSAHLIDLAKTASRAFVLEPALGPGGKVKTARKGVGRFTVVVKGRAAHAGLDPGQGASAIVELAMVIQKLFALNAPQLGTTVNVGMIEGGIRPNVVAPESKAVVDVRVLTTEEGQRVEAAIRGIQPTTPNTTIEISGGVNRPPLEPTERNQRLWVLARDLGQQIGLTLEEGTAGGGSDGNLISPFTAVLDGLGGVGDGAHAIHEFIRVDELPRRTALLALLLLAPASS